MYRGGQVSHELDLSGEVSLKQITVEPKFDNRVRCDWQQKGRRKVFMSGMKNG